VDAHGQADVILAANCFCHVPDVNSLAAGVRKLLKPEGLLIFEDPYLGDILRLGSYDQIYDEHAFYFSVTAVSNWLAHHDMEVIDAQPLAVRGGSLRYTVARRGRRSRTPAIARLLREERLAGFLQAETYARFAARVRESRGALVGLLHDLRSQGKRVAGYGATSKSTTVLNYCGIGADLVEYISDTTPQKQGRYSPGAHVPIRSPAEFRGRYPDYALLFAWNHAAEILAKERGFAAAGGKWIVYVPEVKIVSGPSCSGDTFIGP
jgi:methylation protein EvaC